MRLLLPTLATLITITATAQYGTFNSATVKAARTTKAVVVLDAGDSPYNRAVMNAMKSGWKFTTAMEFVSTAELAAQPISPDRIYLLKITKTDPVKFQATFLTLVKGWKPKKSAG